MEEALGYFQKALEQARKAEESEHEINVLNNIALLHEAAQKYTEAIESMNAALALDPESKKIKTKIEQLEEMLDSQMQGNQLSPQ